MFKEVVERKVSDPVERLTHLIKFTDGETKGLIKHCIHLTLDIRYDTAITLLLRCYYAAITLLNITYDNPHSV